MKKALIEIWIKDATPRDSNISLRKAVEAVAASDSDFAARMKQNGIENILDASPGCVRLPPADAERVVNQLRSVGRKVATRDISQVKKTSSRSRSAARRSYLKRRS